jgi:hypothetical protein
MVRYDCATRISKCPHHRTDVCILAAVRGELEMQYVEGLPHGTEERLGRKTRFVLINAERRGIIADMKENRY